MIALDVETPTKTQTQKIMAGSDGPADYLVMGDFGGRLVTPAAVDRDNLDDVLARQDIVLAGAPIRELEDFHPDRLYRNLEIFRDFREDEANAPPVREQTSPRPDVDEILRPASLLEQIAEGGDAFELYVRALGRAHAAAPASSDPRKSEARNERMRALLHHPRFQSLEAAWRGLDFLTRRKDDRSARVHLAQCSKDDLITDVLNATDLKATRLRGLLRSREWRGFFGLYRFGTDAADIELLGRIALLAGNTHTPFIAEGSVIDDDMRPHWEELRALPEAGLIGLALPRFLLRVPYGPRTSAIDSFEFEEMPGAPVHSEYLWGSPALACLTILSSETEDLNLSDLPLHSYQEDGEWKATPCAEILMTEAQVDALIDLGLMPLVSFRDSDRVRLAGFRAINGKALPFAN